MAHQVLVWEEKYHSSWWNGSWKNYSVYCFSLSSFHFWKRQGTLPCHCSSFNSLTLEKNCWRMDQHELHFVLWSKWATRKKKHSILWVVSLQHNYERNYSTFITQQVPNSHHKLWSLSPWLLGRYHEHSFPVHYCWWSSSSEK